MDAPAVGARARRPRCRHRRRARAPWRAASSGEQDLQPAAHDQRHVRSVRAGPSALFEPPTAADIDKALSALEEKGPTPSSRSRRRRPRSSIARPTSSVGDDEPTKVFDVAAQEFAVHEAITRPEQLVGRAPACLSPPTAPATI